MSRKKGSKNKPKEVKEVKKQVPTKEEVTVNVSNETAIPAETVAPKKDCQHCGHDKEMHYGSQHNWCNFPNCRCDAWKQ